MPDLHLDNFLSGSPSILTDSEEGQLNKELSLASRIGTEEKEWEGVMGLYGAVRQEGRIKSV